MWLWLIAVGASICVACPAAAGEEDLPRWGTSNVNWDWLAYEDICERYSEHAFRELGAVWIFGEECPKELLDLIPKKYLERKGEEVKSNLLAAVAACGSHDPLTRLAGQFWIRGLGETSEVILFDLATAQDAGAELRASICNAFQLIIPKGRALEAVKACLEDRRVVTRREGERLLESRVCDLAMAALWPYLEDTPKPFPWLAPGSNRSHLDEGIKRLLHAFADKTVKSSPKEPDLFALREGLLRSRPAWEGSLASAERVRQIACFLNSPFLREKQAERLLNELATRYGCQGLEEFMNHTRKLRGRGMPCTSFDGMSGPIIPALIDYLKTGTDNAHKASILWAVVDAALTPSQLDAVAASLDDRGSYVVVDIRPEAAEKYRYCAPKEALFQETIEVRSVAASCLQWLGEKRGLKVPEAASTPKGREASVKQIKEWYAANREALHRILEQKRE